MRPTFVKSRDLDETYDVVVVGCGYAGAVAAIAAHDAGARVAILEKAAHAGGISICSAGGVRYARDVAGVRAYLARTCAGTTPLPVLDALAKPMARLPDQIRALAEINGAEISVDESGANYPLEGYDSFGFVNVEAVPGFDPRRDYPHVRGSANGAMLFKVVADNLARREIPILHSTRAERLLLAPDGAVAGLVAARGRRRARIGARRGVILCSGGFEGDSEMQRQYWAAGPALTAAYALNTGDGIRMGQGAGADLWHMWHYHGSYGYRHPDPAYPYAIRVKRLPDWRPGQGRELPKMAWILLDQDGKRFMNEYEPYMQDTGHRPLGEYDPVRQGFPRDPAFLVTDEAGRRLYPLGRPTYNDPHVAFDWSEDNSAEIAKGIFLKARTLKELAQFAGLDAKRVAASLADWNAACKAGGDAAFGRPAASMMALETPPYYLAKVHPLVSNTQGGLVHDPRHRVLDAEGKPIARLYAAGEITSVFGHLYLSGGNLAECFVGGRIAGRAAAREASWI